MKYKKSTNAEVLRRVIAVTQLLVESVPRKQILEYARNTWGVSRAMADNYIAKAKAKIQADGEENIRYLRNIAIMRLEMLYNKCILKEDYSTARLVAMDMNKMHGIDKPDDHSADNLKNALSRLDEMIIRNAEEYEKKT